jgi:cell division protein ZapD
VNTQTTTYEFPLNERMRVFMRLEHLFTQLRHFLAGNTCSDKRAVMMTLIDVLSIFSRNNLKSELLIEIERLYRLLSSGSNSLEVGGEKRQQMLKQLEETKNNLYASSGKVGAKLISNNLFQSVSQRSAIPGGSCSFDLPAFHYWLAQDESVQMKELDEWTQPFLEIHDAIELVLNFIRESSAATEEVAKAGFFQLSLPLDANESVQLLRVEVPKSTPCFAEISGGKHRFTVRFMSLGVDSERPSQTHRDIAFTLTRCQL